MNLSQLLLILKARVRVILLIFAMTVITAVVISLLMPKSYTATTSLVFNYKGQDPVTGVTLPAQLMPGYIDTQINIITSRNVATKVVDQLKITESESAQEIFNEDAKGRGDIHAWYADKLLEKLEVKPLLESSVIEISFMGSDPEFAADVANAFAKAYQQTNIQLKVEPAREAANFLAEQIKILRANVEAAQAKVSKYQQEKGLTEMVGSLDVESARLNDISAQFVLAQSQAFESTSRQLSASAGADQSPDVAASPVVQSIKIDISRAESKLSELSQRLGENHPQYQAASAELIKLRGALQDETHKASSSVGGAARIYQQRAAELRAALSAQKSRVLELNLSRSEFSVLQRDFENAQRALDAASQRFTQTTLEGNVKQTDAVVFNQAIPPLDPTSPKILLNLLLSIFLGTLLGIGFGLLAEMMDRRVRSGNDLSELLEVPVFTITEDKSLQDNGQRLIAAPRRLLGSA